MKFPFYKPLDVICIDGRDYELCLTLENVLRYFDLSENPEGFTPADIDEIMISWFVPEYCTSDREKISAVMRIIEHDYIDTGKRQVRSRRKSGKVVDFTLDSGYIYAAFMQTYGIDLYECADELNWRKFIFLFENLPENTAIAQIMSIRAREVDPKATPEEQQRLAELKVMYALPNSSPTSEADSRNMLNGLFDFLYKKAKGGG